MANQFLDSDLKRLSNGGYKEGIPMGGTYNATPPTLADGDLEAVQLDNAGNMKVNIITGAATGAVDKSAFTNGTSNESTVGGVYQSSPDTITTGTQAAIAIDANRNVQTNMATKLAGEDLTVDVLKVEERFNYSPITTQTTTVIKSGAGFLHGLDYTATANGVITIYDNTAANGTKIRTITSPAVLLMNEVNKILDISFAIGLTIVTSGASQDIVVSSR